MNLEVVASSQEQLPQAFPPRDERRLHPALVSLAEALAARYGGGVLVEEFAGPYGRADFVLVDYEPEVLKSRLAAGLPPIRTGSHTKVIGALSSRYARPADEVAARTGLWLPTVERSLSSLVRSGAISKTADARYRRHPALVPVASLLALEAKLSDWGRAIEQARKYALWSHRTVVVLETLTNKEATLSRARRLGLGVAVESSLLVRPRQRRIPDHLALQASEALLETLAPLSR